MVRKTLLCLCLCATASLHPLAQMRATAQSPSVVDAAMQGRVDAVRALLKAGADVNSAQGDHFTALHYAAQNNNVELARVLIQAGANLGATTRIGGYTPLLVASKNGNAAIVETLVRAGADPNLANTNGTTALVFASEAGSAEAVKVLIAAGVDVNARENVRGNTALMFAAAYGRVDVVRVLAANGADLNVHGRVIDLDPFLKEEAAARKRRASPAGKPVAEVPGIDRRYTFTELVGGWGGLTPLHLAARQGYFETVRELLHAGADINSRAAGDNTTPLLIATLNGRFDLAKYLLDNGADPNAAQGNGVTPLYAALNVQWSAKSFYPQPRAYEQQKTTYLDLMIALLDKGADPQQRTRQKVWTSNYDRDRSGVDDAGATAFWRAAYAADVAAMKLLIARGADPGIPTMRTPGTAAPAGDNSGDVLDDISGLPPVPVGGSGVPPLLAASGEGYSDGYAANVHRFAPTGMLAAVRFLIEEVRVDVNAIDQWGNTSLHNAAARGDNEMIEYLIAKGADPHAVNRFGQTTVDMANGPVQRTLPFPKTIKLLEGMGVKNNHRCVSC